MWTYHKIYESANVNMHSRIHTCTHYTTHIDTTDDTPVQLIDHHDHACYAFCPSLSLSLLPEGNGNIVNIKL